MILEQQALIELGSARWAQKHAVTIGPRFEADTTAQKIAADYLWGITQLVSTGRLAGDSDFLKSLRAELAQVAETGRFDKKRLRVASTELEREIVDALALSLPDEH